MKQYITALVAVMTLVGLSIAGAGGVAAQSGNLLDEEVSTTDLNSVWADFDGAENMNGTGPANVTIDVIGVEEGQDKANGTTLDSTTISVAENSTESYEYTLSDSELDSYAAVHFVANTSDGDIVSLAEWGTTQTLLGGGGGLGGSMGTAGIAVLVLLAYFVLRSDD